MELVSVFKQLLENQPHTPSSNTVKSYLSDIRSFSQWYATTHNTELLVQNISQQLIESFLQTSPLAPRSKERQLAAVKKLTQLLVENNLLQSNPFPKVVTTSIPVDYWKIRDFKYALLKQRASPLTIKNYLSDIHHFTKWLDAQNITQIDQNASEEIMNSYKSFLIHVLSFSPKSVNRKLSTIRKYIDTFSEKKLLDVKPPQIAEEVPREHANHSMPAATQTTDLSHLQAFQVDINDYASRPAVRFFQKLVNEYGKFEEHLAFKTAKIVPKNALKIPVLDKSSIFTQLRRNRPQWYQKYHTHRLTTHFHVLILALFCMSLMVFGYAKYFDIPQPGDVLGISQQNGRVLVYSGTVKNTNNKPLSHTIQARFSIYPDGTANDSTLWEETHQINLNEDGSFTVQLGRKNPLQTSFFTANQNLYLGVKINDEPELLPRQRLANVGYSADAALLNGMEAITQNPDNTKNSILALNSSGDLVIGGSANPTFQAAGGELTISGTTTVLTSNVGSSGNVVINPDGSGVIDIRKPIVNDSQNASASGSVDFADEVSIATESAGPVLIVENTSNSGAILALLSENLTRMLVDSSGKVGIGTSEPRELVHIANASTPSLLIENTLSGASLHMSVQDLQATIGTKTNTPFGFKTNDMTRMTISPTGNVGIGTLAPTALLDVGGTANIGGILQFSGQDQRIQSANNNNLIIGGKSTGNLLLQPLISDGFIGISNTNPQYKLDIADSQSKKAVTQITNISDSTQSAGLNIQLGTNTSSNQFISFQTRSQGVVGAITGGGSGVQYHTTAADFAEYFKKSSSETMSYGIIACLNTSGLVSTCTAGNNNIVGVVSEKPGFVGGKNLGNNSAIIGLVGQIETVVSNRNGNIMPGDPITAYEGIGVKATQGGKIVGRALQAYTGTNPGKILVFVQPSWHDPSLSYSSSGEIHTTAVPDINLDTATYEQVAASVAQSTHRVTNGSTVIQSLASFASASIGNIKAGLIETQSLLVNGTFVAKNAVVEQLHITSDNFTINGQSLQQYIAQIVSQENSQETVKTTIISPLSDTAAIEMELSDSALTVNNTENGTSSAVASIDNNGNATFNGTVQGQTGAFETINTSGDASISGTLTANMIKANTIDGIEDTISSITNRLFSREPSDSTYIDVSTMSAEFALFHQNLLSLGTTTLREATVLDTLTLGSEFVFGQDSLNTLSVDLQIQPLRQAGVSFLGGLMTLDTDGKLYVGSDARFAKNVTVEGGLFAQILSPIPGNNLDIYLPSNNGSGSAEFRVVNDSKTPVFGVNTSGDVYSSGSANFAGNLVASGSAFLSKLNIFSQDAYAVSDTELEASSSAGTAVLKAYKSEITIKNPHVSGKSLIYITPSTNTGNKVLYLLRQSVDGSFTVGISEPTNTDVQFNWIVVN